jgi:hypothetical protein
MGSVLWWCCSCWGLLAERSILEAYLGGSKTRSLRVFDIAIVPLLILLCLLVGLRFASLLGGYPA